MDDLDESKFELNELNLLNGSVAQEFEGYIQENNLQQIQVLSGTTVSQTGVVKTELIDVEKQDDTLKLIFDDSSSPNSFIIISKSILTLNNLENGYLNLNIRTLEKDKPLYFILMCGFDCMGTLNFTDYIEKSQSFRDYSIPLKCLTEQGVDLSKVNIPFILMGEGPLEIDFKKGLILQKTRRARL